MDWLMYRPGAKMVVAAVAIARRLGFEITDDQVPALERVANAWDGEARAGPLRAFAHTTYSNNREEENVPHTSQGVEVQVDGGILVVDSLGANVRGTPATDVLAAARAWDVEQLTPRLEWLTHPTLPAAWRGTVESNDLLNPRVLWQTSVTSTSHAVVPFGEDLFLVALASNGRTHPLASIIGRWAGAPQLDWHRWVSQGVSAPAEMAERIGAAPLLEWEARQASPVALWHVHLRPAEDAARLQRWRAGNHLVRCVARADGGGTERLIQPLQGADWCAHLEGILMDGRWHWSGFSTHPAGLAHLEELVNPRA